MKKKKSLEYTYSKERSEFGRQCLFADATFTNTELSDRELRDQFIRRNPIDATSDNIPDRSCSGTNTISESYLECGVTHVEGGWPKDLNINDEEQTLRYRKRIEREGKYEKQLKKLVGPTEHIVKQNNAVNVMEEYFDMVKNDACNGPASTTIDSISCFVYPDGVVPANHVSFSTKSGTEMVVAYANVRYPMDRESNRFSCVWDIGYSQTPILKLETKSQFIQLEYNRKDEFLIAGGRADGIVSVFDTRAGGKAQLNSELEYSHKEHITSLQWIQSKTNTELFTGAGDGAVMWWDTRSLAAPYESYTLESEIVSKSMPNPEVIGNVKNESVKVDSDAAASAPPPRKFVAGCTILEYIQSMPTRFSVGTQNGIIFSGNKRGNTFEERFPQKINCFAGPVRSLERNPFSDKNFLAVGDYGVKIWSDEQMDSCIWSTRYYNEYLTFGCWNKNRCPTIFVGLASGRVDIWDLLLDQKAPVAMLNKSKHKVLHLPISVSSTFHRCFVSHSTGASH